MENETSAPLSLLALCVRKQVSSARGGAGCPREEPEVVCVATWTVGILGIRALQGGWSSRVENQAISQPGTCFQRRAGSGKGVANLGSYP